MRPSLDFLINKFYFFKNLMQYISLIAANLFQILDVVILGI